MRKVFYIAVAAAATLVGRVANGADTNTLAIDLPSALRLAGARNLDILIAKEKLAEAKANQEIALWRFFPSLVPGVGYRRHDDLIQDVSGNVISVHKDSYAFGPALDAQLDVGDAIYKRLSARQIAAAAASAVDAQIQDSSLEAARGYLDLARASSAEKIAEDAVRISGGYAGEVSRAVDAGIAFKGDALRASVQADRDRIALRQAREFRTIASAQLVKTLHLDSKLVLVAREDDPAPISLVATNAGLDFLIAQALSARPEVKRSAALVAAAEKAKAGVRYGPLVPSLGAQVFAGGFGGSRDNLPGQFGGSEDYQVSLGWRIGPGGLFDRGRLHASEAQLNQTRLADNQLYDEISRQVIQAYTRVHSTEDQLATARHAVESASEAFRLTSQRKEFAVGIVLETVQAEQDLTQTRLSYLNAVAELDKAQFELARASGQILISSDRDPAPGPK